MVMGMAGFNAFTRQVFRPNETWARMLAWLISATMLFGMSLTHFTNGYAAELDAMGTGYLIQQLGAMGTLAWAAWESLRYASILARRFELGLVDPVVLNRVRLWGIAMGLAFVLASTTIGAHLMGIDMMGTVPGAAFVGCVGFIAGSAIYLAFLPPRAYTNWVTGRLQAATSG